MVQPPILPALVSPVSPVHYHIGEFEDADNIVDTNRRGSWILSPENGHVAASTGTVAKIVVRSAMRKAAGFKEKVLVADKMVPQLGFAPTGSPPGCVAVGRLPMGCWAAEHGIQRHDELLSINGHQISEFKNSEELSQALKKRPLRLVFLQEPPDSEEAARVKTCLDVTAKAAAEKQAIAAEKDKAANRATRQAISKVIAAKAALEQVLQQAGTACHSLCPEMEELSIESELFEAFGELAEKMEEAHDVEVQEIQHQLLDECPELCFMCVADDDVTQFGFTCDTSSWQVRTVEDDGWAQEQGAQVGDLLLMVNEELTDHMSHADLIKYMRTRRPLQLTFLRTEPPVKKSLPLASVYSAAAMMGRMVNAKAEVDSESDSDSDAEPKAPQITVMQYFGGLFRGGGPAPLAPLAEEKEQERADDPFMTTPLASISEEKDEETADDALISDQSTDV